MQKSSDYVATLQNLANQHRAAILARDQALAHQITAHYQAIWQRIYARLQQLTKQIDAAQKAGKPVKVSWLYEQRRMQVFLGQVQSEINQFAAYSQHVVQLQMFQGAQWGSQDALNLLDHQLGSVYGSFNHLPSEAIRQAVYNVETDAHLQKLFGSFSPQAVDLVKKRLVSAVALGENPRQIARDIQQALGTPLWRALMIARTETINAYRDSSLNVYRANSDVVSGWTWLAAPGACPFCQSMDGTQHDLSEDMSSHPNCRCTPQPNTPSFEEILANAA